MRWAVCVFCFLACLISIEANASDEIDPGLQFGLIVTGHYFGPVDGLVGPRTMQAIADYQSELGYPSTGHLTPNEARQLKSVLEDALIEFGIYPELDEASGIWLMLPGRLLNPSAPTLRGFQYTGDTANLVLETIRIPAEDRSFADLYDRMSSTSPGRTTAYHALTEEWFVVTFTERGRTFYTRFFTNGVEHRGFSVAYDSEANDDLSPLVILISETFSPFDPAPANSSRVFYGSEDDRRLLIQIPFDDTTSTVTANADLIGVGAGFYVASNLVVTDANVVESCQLLTLGTGERAEISSVDRANHVALLEAPTSSAFLPIADFAVERGEPVATVGTRSADSVNDQLDVLLSSVLSPIGPNGEVTQFVVEGRLQSGISGGPIINQQGQVIGLSVNAVLGEQLASASGISFSDTSLGIHIDSLRLALLDAGLTNIVDGSRSQVSSQNVQTNPRDIIDIAKNSVVEILCYQ